MNNHRYIPLIAAVACGVGILIGSFYAGRFSHRSLSLVGTSGSKLQDLLHIIDEKYVDETNIDSLTERTIPLLLSELDPHSSYSDAQTVEADMEGLEGGFSGIGVSFKILDDTLMVVGTVRGGPAAEVGILAGDRIIGVDGRPFVGEGVSEQLALNTLKGKNGSRVALNLLRGGDTLSVTVTRGEVALPSIEAAYIIEKPVSRRRTGLIDLRLFGETTYGELLAALAELSHQGMEQLIIDLRQNHGGYMEPAIKMANEFLPQGQMVVYTEGRRSKRASYVSDGRGSYQTLPLIVLVSEETASAAEIFAAAMQDNDRAVVVGRRTFGKGLVQEPILFGDGSMLRLTIARYYTASGRCLQKPYVEGRVGDYEMEIIERYERGEAFSSDSVHHQGREYKTRLGRTVYGGGGVSPDYFVAADTAGTTPYYTEAVTSGLVGNWAFRYADAFRDKLSAMNLEGLVAHLQKQRLPDEFARWAEQRGLKRRNVSLKKSYSVLERMLMAMIVDYVLDSEARLRYVNEQDAAVQRALELLDAGEAFPTGTTEADDGQDGTEKGLA